jgi:hypothetical protein
MTNFKEALLAELTAQVTAPEPVRRPVRRWAVAATGAAAVIAAAAIVLVVAPQQQERAFALTEQPDGTFVLKWSDLDPDHFEEANRAMREAGVRARIYHIGEYGSCPGYDRHTLNYYRGPSPSLKFAQTGSDWVIPRMPHDATMLFLVSNRSQRVIAGEVVSGPVPPCIQEFWTDTPTGSPSPSPSTPSESGTPSASPSPEAD